MSHWVGTVHDVSETAPRLRDTYRKLVQYRRLTWARACAIAVTALLRTVFVLELRTANNDLAERTREQLRPAIFVGAVAATAWTRHIVRRRHMVGADLYEDGQLPPASPWPTIAASIAVAVIGAAATLLSQR